MGQDKDSEIIYHLPSQSKKIQLGKEQYHLLLIKDRVGW